MEKLKKLILDHNIDLVGLTEVNKDWRKISYPNTIWGATSGWKEQRRIQVAQNVTKPAQESEHLVGGVAIAAFGDLVYRISDQGTDERNLGRWGYITITGKNNVTTSIFTCYCPCRGKSPGSAYSQQLIYMAENKDQLPDTNCPRQLFGMDLKEVIGKKIEQGHQIILMGDFNSEYSELESWMLELGLQDLIGKKHGKGPKTYNRSKDAPIDCVFGSASLQISKGGFLSFGRLMSDHRGVWVDIPKFLLYGYNPPQPHFFHARKLKITDPRVVSKYLTYLHCAMKDHDLFQRMDDIHRDACYPFSERLMDRYEEIDVIVGRLMDEAENQCRKIHTGSIPWSPAYKRACLELEYWLKRRSHFKKKHHNVRQLLVLQNKLQIQYNPDLSLAEIEAHIKVAHKSRKKCKDLAESLSLEYRTQLALAKEEAGELKAAVYLRNVNHREAQRRLFRNIRHMEGKIKGGSTSKLTTLVNGHTVEHTDKASIDSLMAAANEKKYHVTEGGSQLLSREYIESFGAHGEGKDIQAVLDGSFLAPASATPATKDFLSACKYNAEAKDLARRKDVVLRYRDHVKSWNIRQEKTCSHHHHMGHYKSIFKDKHLSWFFFQRADIPDMTGYSPNRHRECIDLMIMKKSMCYDINKQRTLGILDTEFNQNNKRVGRDGMNNALKLNKIAKEQYAIKNTSSIDQIVAKRCVIDHNRSIRRCLALTSSDLEGCYDRIIHTAAALALLRVGIPHTRIRSMFSSIQRMVHRIRSAFGDSELTYGGDDIGDWENYPQGVLQGNASGPTIWSLLSSIVFEVLHKRGFATKFCTSLSKQIFQLVGFAYVDDCDLVQVGTNPVEVLESMQQLINSWGSLMEVTGGALSVEKSWWYLVDFVWKRGKWVAKDAETELDLVATSSKGERVSLRRLRAHEASKMLGVWVAPDGSHTKLIREQKISAIEWGAKVKSGNSSREEAWQALHSNISAKLKYPLPACTLTEAECKSIMYPAIKAALPKAGISAHISKCIRDGPIGSGGSGVLSLYNYQGTSRTSMLVEQVNKKTPTGLFLLTCIEDLVLDAGLYGPLWDMPFHRISAYIQSHSLVYHTCKYNASNDIQISVNHGELEPQRYGDEAIMHVASQFFGEGKEIRAIQRVRTSFAVVHISDVSSADGRKMDRFFLATKQVRKIRNTHNWPLKHHVTKADYTVWRKLLRLIFSADNEHLPTPLGKWIDMPTEDWLANWDYFISSDKQFLYHRLGKSNWRRHLQKDYSHRSYHTPYLQLDEPPEDTLIRVTIQDHKNERNVISLSHKGIHTPDEVTNFLTYDQITISKPKINWFMTSVSSSPTTANLLQHLIHGTAYGVSDGSFYPNTRTGSCAWIISTPDGTEYIQGGGLVPGESEDQDPYRSELGGQLGLAAMASGIQLPNGISPIFTIACDGLSALNQVGTDKARIKAKLKHVDFISAISAMWEDAKFTLKKEHVYGHQDDLNLPLTNLEKLNCRMDIEAKAIAQAHICGNAAPPIFHPTKIGFGTVRIKNKLVTSRIQTSLYKHITHDALVHWVGKHSKPLLNLKAANIAWHSFQVARREASLGMKIFVTKWISGDTATGRVMVQRKKREHSNCPRCNQEDEHLLHILTCKSVDTISIRNNLLSELIMWLRSVRTHPILITFLRKGLRRWFTNTTYTFKQGSSIFTDNLASNKAIQAQINIGWFNLLRGFLCQDIVHMQQSHYSDMGSRKSGSRWASTLIKKLWNITLQLWLHRNEALHKTDAINLLSGLVPLKKTIAAEYNLGPKDLPGVYSTYFHIPLQILLTKHAGYLKKWFLVIRSARETCSIATTLDEFSSNGPLRAWVGLSTID